MVPVAGFPALSLLFQIGEIEQTAGLPLAEGAENAWSALEGPAGPPVDGPVLPMAVRCHRPSTCSLHRRGDSRLPWDRKSEQPIVTTTSPPPGRIHAAAPGAGHLRSLQRIARQQGRAEVFVGIVVIEGVKASASGESLPKVDYTARASDHRSRLRPGSHAGAPCLDPVLAQGCRGAHRRHFGRPG